jgi:membrane fusion protein, multidrug efflux system
VPAGGQLQERPRSSLAPPGSLIVALLQPIARSYEERNMDQAPSVSPSGPANSTFAPETKKRRHLWIWVVVLLLFGLLFYWVWNHKAQSAQQGGGGGGRGRFAMGGPVPVTMATAHTGDLPVYLNAIGTVTPVSTVSITAQVTGVIQQVHYREGQNVKKGDPLIDIDPRPFEAQVTQAQGVLERDQHLLAQAQMDLERYQLAWQKNAISRQTLEDQEKLVLQTQGTVKNDEGAVQYAQVQLAYCHITSPITGRVGLRLVDPGNLVTANATNALVVVTQIQPITVIFTIPQDSLPEVVKQMRGGPALEVDAFDRTQQNQLGSGKLLTIDNQIDTTTGTVKLRAEFANATGMLFPNQFVNTRLLVKTLKSQLMIPSSAIQYNGDTAFVYLIQGNKAVMRNVKAGASESGNTVVSGLNPGDVVADSSFEKLQDGSQIKKSDIAIPTTSTSESPAQ